MDYRSILYRNSAPDARRRVTQLTKQLVKQQTGKVAIALRLMV